MNYSLEGRTEKLVMVKGERIKGRDVCGRSLGCCTES